MVKSISIANALNYLKRLSYTRAGALRVALEPSDYAATTSVVGVSVNNTPTVNVQGSTSFTPVSVMNPGSTQTTNGPLAVCLTSPLGLGYAGPGLYQTLLNYQAGPRAAITVTHT